MLKFLLGFFYKNNMSEEHDQKNMSCDNVTINVNEIKSYIFVFEARPNEIVDVSLFQSGEKDDWLKNKVFRFGLDMKKVVFPIYESLEELWQRETARSKKDFYFSRGCILCLNGTPDEVYRLIESSRFHEAYLSALTIPEAEKLVKSTENNQNVSACII